MDPGHLKLMTPEDQKIMIRYTEPALKEHIKALESEIKEIGESSTKVKPTGSIYDEAQQANIDFMSSKVAHNEEEIKILNTEKTNTLDKVNALMDEYRTESLLSNEWCRYIITGIMSKLSPDDIPVELKAKVSMIPTLNVEPAQLPSGDLFSKTYDSVAKDSENKNLMLEILAEIVRIFELPY